MPPIDLHTLHTEDDTKMQERTSEQLGFILAEVEPPLTLYFFPSQKQLKIQLNNKSSIIKGI